MSNAIKTIPALTVGTTAIPLTTGKFHKWASVSLQADSANSGIVYVGDSLVSATRYSRALSAGDWYSLAGSSVDPTLVYVVASAAAQIVHGSGS